MSQNWLRLPPIQAKWFNKFALVKIKHTQHTQTQAKSTFLDLNKQKPQDHLIIFRKVIDFFDKIKHHCFFGDFQQFDINGDFMTSLIQIITVLWPFKIKANLREKKWIVYYFSSNVNCTAIFCQIWRNEFDNLIVNLNLDHFMTLSSVFW